jgi:hypothetical protein
VLNKALCHEDTWESGGIAPPFMILALDGGEWSPLRPGHFTPRDRAPSTHWIGGWVDLKASLDAVECRKKSVAPARSLTLVTQPVACYCTDLAILAVYHRRIEHLKFLDTAGLACCTTCMQNCNNVTHAGEARTEEM